MKEPAWADTEFFREMLSEADGQTMLLSDDDSLPSGAHASGALSAGFQLARYLPGLFQPLY